LVPPGSKYGYDLIAETGKLRFLEHKQIKEIVEEFSRRGIGVPGRTIQSLCDRFLLYIIAVHWESLPRLSQLFKTRGGYVLHIDGSGKCGPMVLLMKEGWTGIRLLTTQIESEAAKNVVPYLKQIEQNFGNPVAIVSDMSDGILAAIPDVFPDTYVIICHYHFLRSVGLKLFEPFYPRFRNKVNHRGVKVKLRVVRGILRRRNDLDEDEALTLAIAEYVLAYEKDGNGLAYPFSLPAVDFYRRCVEAKERTRKAILARSKRNMSSKLLCRLEEILNRLSPPPAVLGRLQTDFEALCVRWTWFQRIRIALRYRNGPIPLSTTIRLSDKDLEKGRSKLDRILTKISAYNAKVGIDHHGRGLGKALKKIAEMIMERRDNLFAPNVLVKADGKLKVRRLPRTNTPEEWEFRMARRHGRRIRGNSNIEQQFQRDGPGMLMVQNLRDRKYVQLVYGSTGQMATRFSTVSQESLERAKSYMGVSPGLSMAGNHGLPQ
jgi:hypothetical protein